MNIRYRFLLPIVLAVLAFSGACRSATPVPPLGHGCVPTTRPEAPIAVIDDSGSQLSVDPPHLVTYDEYPKGSGRPMVILFFTRSGTGDFRIVEKNGNCIASQDCVAGAGLCRVTVKKIEDGRPRTCDYGVDMKGFPYFDPTITVNPCC